VLPGGGAAVGSNPVGHQAPLVAEVCHVEVTRDPEMRVASASGARAGQELDMLGHLRPPDPVNTSATSPSGLAKCPCVSFAKCYAWPSARGTLCTGIGSGTKQCPSGPG
jgi:hypothetical protein